MKYEQKIKNMGYELPSLAKSKGIYVQVVRAHGFLFLAGTLPEVNGGIKYRGKLGAELSIESGREASRLCVLNGLSIIKNELGDIDRLGYFVRLVGYVNSSPGFTEQPKVIDGASQFILDVFGDLGKHARIAVGVSELPLNASVEIEMIVCI